MQNSEQSATKSSEGLIKTEIIADGIKPEDIDQALLAQQKALAAQCLEVLDEGKSVLIYGSFGTGKSIVAQAIMRHYNLSDRKTISADGDFFCEDVIVSRGVALEKYRNTGILFMDDFELGHRELNIMGSSLPALRMVIKHRLKNKYPTIMTTNVPPGKLKEFLGKHWFERFAQHVKPMKLNGHKSLRNQFRNLYQ